VRAPTVTAQSWERFRVNSALPAPLYHQIFAMLRDQILGGSFEPGQAFPSESAIVHALGVSRITARRALEELAARGLIQREQGRASRVAPYRPGTRLVAGVEGMIENNRLMGDQTRVELLGQDMVPASPEIARKLRLRRGERVQWSVRVRSLDGQPFSYAVTHLPARVARLIGAERMSTRPLIDLLEEAGIRIGHAEQTISATDANADVARALHVEPGSALLVSDRVVHDQNDRPVQAISVLYRPDVYQYRVDLRRTHSPTGNRWAAAPVRAARLDAAQPRAATPRRQRPPGR
jgi:GntR family transcriptional regulator